MQPALNTLAEPAAVQSPAIVSAVGVAGVVALAAVMLWRRLPPGSAAGALVATLSSAALLLAVVPGGPNRPAAVRVLAGLTACWYAVWQLRQQSRRADEQAPVFGHAAVLCGVITLVEALPAVSRSVSAGVSAGLEPVSQIALLAGVGVALWGLNQQRWAAYPLIALLGCMLTGVFAATPLPTDATAVALTLDAGAGLTLVALLGVVLRRWWLRRRAWLTDPTRPAPSCGYSGACLKLLATAGALVGLSGAVVPAHPLTPPAVFLAALTCLTIGHLRNRPLVGEIGLALVGGGVVSAVLAWLRPESFGLLLGISVAGLYLLWLARFWDQQLNNGRAWTTAGRLIPAAHRLTCAAAPAALAAALHEGLREHAATSPGWAGALSVAVLLGWMSLLIRDGAEHRRPGAVWAAWFAAGAVTVPTQALLRNWTGVEVPLLTLFSAAAVLLGLRALAGPRWSGTRSACGAGLIGVVPVAAVLGRLLGGAGPAATIALVLAVASVSLGLKLTGRASEAPADDGG